MNYLLLGKMIHSHPDLFFIFITNNNYSHHKTDGDNDM